MWYTVDMGKTLSESEYDRRIGSDYLRLQPYIKVDTKILHRHKCGYEWSVRPRNILGRPGTCPKCFSERNGDNTRLSDADHDARLVAAGGEYIRLQPYSGSNIKILHRHVPCGHEWEVTPSQLMTYPGTCPLCYESTRGARQTHDSDCYDAALIAAGAEYLRLEPYVSSKTKILHRHVPCGYERLVVPSSILSRPVSCPECAKHGFDPTSAGHLYLLNVGGTCLKYGITSDVNRRLSELRRLSPKLITVIRSWQFDLGSTARDIELLIKVKFGGAYIDQSVLPDGWTETLDPALRDEVIQFIENTIK